MRGLTCVIDGAVLLLAEKAELSHIVRALNGVSKALETVIEALPWGDTPDTNDRIAPAGLADVRLRKGRVSP